MRNQVNDQRREHDHADRCRRLQGVSPHTCHDTHPKRVMSTVYRGLRQFGVTLVTVKSAPGALRFFPNGVTGATGVGDKRGAI